MTLTEKQFNSIVEDVMTDLPFVEWGRGTNYTTDDGLRVCTIYGWIEREKDDYKEDLFKNLQNRRFLDRFLNGGESF